MKNKKLVLSLALAGGIFIAILIADLLSKHFIFQMLPNSGDSKDAISGFFNLLHVENTGAAWGMLAGRPVFLILISLIILAVYLWFYVIRLKKHKENTSVVLSVSVGFIVGGCFGNLIDRIVFGYVRDFINLQFMDFPVFNVADISLTVGIILMIVYFIFIYSKEDKNYDMLMKDLAKFRDENEIINILELPRVDENELGDDKKESNISSNASDTLKDDEKTNTLSGQVENKNHGENDEKR